MPILGALVVSLFTALADFFLRFFSKGIALRLAFAALILTAFGVLYATLQAAAAAVAVTMPTSVATGLEFLLPGNTGACISAAIAADIAAMGYRLYVTGLGGNA